MPIAVVNQESNHLFVGNPIVEQHRLRYDSIIKRQEWDVPSIRNLEYDQYDNPASTYLIYLDDQHKAKGVSRLSPTSKNYMLSDCFGHMVDDAQFLPHQDDIWEGSRFCIAKDEHASVRKRIAQELILAYLEYGLDSGITAYLGLMYPIYWKHLFIDAGWHPEWLGEAQRTNDGKMARAGLVRVSSEILEQMREKTQILDPVTYYTMIEEDAVKAA